MRVALRDTPKLIRVPTGLARSPSAFVVRCPGTVFWAFGYTACSRKQAGRDWPKQLVIKLWYMCATLYHMEPTHITLRIPDDMAVALASRARARDLPRSQVVREALALYLSAGPTRSAPPLTTASDFAARWANLPRLTPAEVTDLESDITASRDALPKTRAPWE